MNIKSIFFLIIITGLNIYYSMNIKSFFFLIIITGLNIFHFLFIGVTDVVWKKGLASAKPRLKETSSQTTNL